MTPEQLATFILATVGVLIQLAIKYLPVFANWYENLEPKAKALWALGFDAGFGLIYFGAACVPVLAELFKITLACDLLNFGVLLQAIGTIVVSQQTAYLVTRKI